MGKHRHYRNNDNRRDARQERGGASNTDNMENNVENTENLENVENLENTDNVTLNDDFAGEAEDTQAEQEVNTLENQLADAQAALEKEKKEYMFLMAEFDNFRKRTIREKSEIIRNAAENVFKGPLPIIDDF